MFACVYVPPSPLTAVHNEQSGGPRSAGTTRLVDVARSCSPRVCVRGEHIATMDIEGMTRLYGNHRAVADRVKRAAVDGGYPLAHVAVAATQTAAMVLASMRPGITVVEAGGETGVLALLPARALAVLMDEHTVAPAMTVLARWGIRTLGQLAALPPVEVSERLGQTGVLWQRWARGEDLAPLTPTLEDDVFEAVFEPEWPIEDTASLSVVLAQMLAPLCRQLDRRDRSAAVLHIRLRLVTRDLHERRLQLPAPMRDPEVLRTLILLALEATPAPAGIDIVMVSVDPAPARVVQESLLTRAVPPPEHVATLMARLSALMGDRRCGSPVLVDSFRPGTVGMVPFQMEAGHVSRKPGGTKGDDAHAEKPGGRPCAALRRFRLPISARVLVEHGRPIQVRTERQNLQGGQVLANAGPWRTSGEWWRAVGPPPSELEKLRGQAGWNRDEWDVALSDGGIYRVFEDRDSGRWFVDGIVD
jgi:protein ImuB